MPTYEYRCQQCDRTFDVVQSFSDEPLTACPTCGGPVKKVFGSVGIVFKGSGFYKTDSRSSTTASKPPSTGTSDSTTATPSSEPAAASTSQTSSPSSSSASAAPTTPASAAS